MYRTALRSTPRALRATRPTLASGSRRLASTTPSPAPASKKSKGSWKGTGLRWGVAAAAVYFYNTSPIFADELPGASLLDWPVCPNTYLAAQVGPAPPHFSDADLPTIDAMIEEKRRQADAAALPPPPPPPPPAPTKAVEAAPTETPSTAADEAKPAETEAAPAAAAAEREAHEPGSPEALAHEATQQGAFDPETGEINWQCPCLGGMADGPCGEEFKAAFSCFVYSKEEPKGMDCIENFQHMQDCFRKFPEVYGSELTDDDEEGAEGAGVEALAKTATEEAAPAAQKEEAATPKKAAEATEGSGAATKAKKQ
ncbi:hypothetical protein C8A05DRAFT_13631 [Staphylotrichum tortipilum]|uniref:Mitochondrial intermembrane space import and assembly protein 40 n=1 Tax=Staphylotrichum tortipilum TaxID=2831512 RepID=A0AAN6RVG7_9PEZI|nr:hypothetical protein C8A05DRAFT_13631 [Staphylotrichum longicolle]